MHSAAHPMLQVPWASLGRAPVIVEMDRLYVLAGPRVETEGPESDENHVRADIAQMLPSCIPLQSCAGHASWVVAQVLLWGLHLLTGLICCTLMPAPACISWKSWWACSILACPAAGYAVSSGAFMCLHLLTGLICCTLMPAPTCISWKSWWACSILACP